MENERGRGREKAVVERRTRGGGGGSARRGKGRRKRGTPTERARGKPGELRGSIGGHRPPQKSAHYRLVRRVDEEATTLAL